jgi:2-polyprenyl-3-methyl-5-hydroxy-6-metoxy-1,4-benzoquinol methylase
MGTGETVLPITGASSGPLVQADQRHYYDEACDPEFEITRPHRCGKLYQFLLAHKFHTGLDLLGLDLTGKTVLEVCCGSGLMAEALASRGARVTGIDFSRAAITRAHQRARRYCFSAQFLTADTGCLPFADRSFDVVAVHDGLHHFADPYRAMREMARVARKGLIILEPAQALMTSFAMRLGIAQDVEEAGNVVRRLVPSQVVSCLRQAGFAHVSWHRTLMYYPHSPPSWFRWFDRPALLALVRAGFWAVNLAVGRWGNKLAVAATRM